jgi:hypothetical protein
MAAKDKGARRVARISPSCRSCFEKIMAYRPRVLA